MSGVKEVLGLFAKRVQQQARTNLKKRDKQDTGKLYEGTTYNLSVHKNSFHLSFNMPDYASFVDKGVRGSKSAAKAPNSPFRFGTGTGKKGGLTEAIKGWTKRKRIQFRDRATGKFLSYESTAWVITKSIYTTGLRPTNFFTTPFENEFKKLPGEIVKAYGLEVNKLMKFVFKK